MSKICAFFGHRECYENLSAELDDAIRRAVIQQGVTTFWCGRQGAFDRQASEAVRRMKAEFPQIKLELILPYLPVGVDERNQRYDATVYPDGLETVPYRFAISRRNSWMAKNCDMVICCIRFTFGGAYQAYRQARSRGKLIWNLSALPEE